MTVWQFLSLGYLIVIIAGSLLLFLPFATKDGQSTTYINALFTSTSATCVTGLVPYDTNTHWSLFGQIVIIILIQTGGLGFMTFVSVLFNLLGRHMGLYERKALMQSAGEGRLSGIRRLVRRIFIGTAIFEGLGAIFLSIRFIPDFGVGKGIYYSVWHSISAFCNAGFDLMGGVFGEETFVSFTHYAADPVVSLTIAFLIIIGGLGFCVWGDIVDNKGNVKKFRLHTKVVLLVNTLMLVASTLLFLLFERNNPTYGRFSTGEKWLVAFFNATTPRTAGFNTIDLNSLSDSGYLLTIGLARRRNQDQHARRHSYGNGRRIPRPQGYQYRKKTGGILAGQSGACHLCFLPHHRNDGDAAHLRHRARRLGFIQTGII